MCCLDKNPERRFQSTIDLAFQLESLMLLSEPTQVVHLAPEKTQSKITIRLGLQLFAVILVLIVLALWTKDRLMSAAPTHVPVLSYLTFSGRISSAP